MEVTLTKKPKNVTIIEGFPGFGLIGTIAIEFLLEHLQTEKIGIIEMTDMPAMIAIHDHKVIEPISLHYNKKYNLVLVHAINIGKDQGWHIASAITEAAKQLQAKEILSLEGVGSPNPGQSRVFYYSTKKTGMKKLEATAQPLMEGIIVGVTGALLAKPSKMPMTALFAEAQSKLPDSTAAAHIVSALDSYLGLKIDPKPLLKQAQQFEEKLKGIVAKTKQAEDVQEQKKLSYVG